MGVNLKCMQAVYMATISSSLLSGKFFRAIGLRLSGPGDFFVFKAVEYQFEILGVEPGRAL